MGFKPASPDMRTVKIEMTIRDLQTIIGALCTEFRECAETEGLARFARYVKILRDDLQDVLTDQTREG